MDDGSKLLDMAATGGGSNGNGDDGEKQVDPELLVNAKETVNSGRGGAAVVGGEPDAVGDGSTKLEERRGIQKLEVEKTMMVREYISTGNCHGREQVC